MEVNTQPRPSTSAVGIRYGLLTGIITLIISFGLFATHSEQGPLRFLSTLVLAGGMVVAMRYYKESNAGYMSFGEGLGIGTILSAVVGVLSAVFTYVYMGFIDQDVVNRMMEKARADMEARGGMSDEQIDQGMAMAGKFMSLPILTVSVLIITVITGFIISLIVSAVLKHSKPEFE